MNNKMKTLEAKTNKITNEELPIKKKPFTPEAAAKQMDNQLQIFCKLYGLDINVKEDVLEARQIIGKTVEYHRMIYALLTQKLIQNAE